MNTHSDTTLPLDNGAPAKGVIHAANEARFSAAHYSEPLTAFSQGWKDPENLASLLDFIAPPIAVARRFEFKKADNAEAFLSETDDIRAIGSAFKRVEYTGTSVNEKTFNKGLTLRIDHDETAGDDWQERHVQLLLQRLLRNELRRAIAALDAASSASPADWPLDGSAANPDADIRNALSLAADASGIRPNRLLFGETAWEIRSTCYDAQNNAGAHRCAALTPSELAHRVFVDEVRIASARYQNGASKNRLAGAALYAFYAQDLLAKDEPAHLKRFVTPTDGGPFRVYIEAHSKYTDITVEHYSNIVACSTLGMTKLTLTP